MQVNQQIPVRQMLNRLDLQGKQLKKQVGQHVAKLEGLSAQKANLVSSQNQISNSSLAIIRRNAQLKFMEELEEQFKNLTAQELFTKELLGQVSQELIQNVQKEQCLSQYLNKINNLTQAEKILNLAELRAISASATLPLNTEVAVRTSNLPSNLRGIIEELQFKIINEFGAQVQNFKTIENNGLRSLTFNYLCSESAIYQVVIQIQPNCQLQLHILTGDKQAPLPVFVESKLNNLIKKQNQSKQQGGR